jgi:hypothetical protein
MLAAALLFLLFALIEFLMVGAAFGETGDARWGQVVEFGVGCVLDLVLGIGLIKGNQRLRGWGLGRVILGGIWVLWSVLSGPGHWLALLENGLELISLIGLAVLLVDESASKLKIGAGALLVLTSLAGLITLDFLNVWLPQPIVREEIERPVIAKKPGAISGAAVDDVELGFSVRLPQGWTLAQAGSVSARLPRAEIAADNWRSGAKAGLVVEPATFDGSLESYLNEVVSRTGKLFPLLELNRTAATLGGRDARRLEFSWVERGVDFRGFVTVCQVGSRYYLLMGWCPNEVYHLADEQFRSLEGSIHISGTDSGGSTLKRADSTRKSLPEPIRKP